MDTKQNITSLESNEPIESTNTFAQTELKPKSPINLNEIDKLITNINTHYSSNSSSFIALKSKIVNYVNDRDFISLKSLLSHIKERLPEIDIAKFTVEGLPLIHYACYNDLSELLDILLDLEIDINLSSNEYVDNDNILTQYASPLIYAIRGGSDALVLKLISHGAIINCKYNVFTRSCRVCDLTPLHAAAYVGRIKIVKLLLQKGADINAVTRDGTSPLHGAVHVGNANAKIVKFLLSKGAIMHLKNIDGLSAADVALKNNFLTIVKIFDNAYKLQALKYLSPLCLFALTLIYFL